MNVGRWGPVVLHVRPEASLVPYIQSRDSPSGEIQLLQRDGASLLYLNSLCQRGGEGMTLRMPLTDQELPVRPSARAILARWCADRPVWAQDFINDLMTRPWHKRGELEG